jgi:hypothetical protein
MELKNHQLLNRGAHQWHKGHIKWRENQISQMLKWGRNAHTTWRSLKPTSFLLCKWGKHFWIYIMIPFQSTLFLFRDELVPYHRHIFAFHCWVMIGFIDDILVARLMKKFSSLCWQPEFRHLEHTCSAPISFLARWILDTLSYCIISYLYIHYSPVCSYLQNRLSHTCVFTIILYAFTASPMHDT